MNKQEKAALIEWVALHRCCAICWWPESDGRRKLDVHHIIGGRGRKNDIRNYVRLCHRDHDILHAGRVAGNFPTLYNSTVLTAKQECDPDNFDPEYLASLLRKKHLGYDPTPIPDFYLAERERNVGSWKNRTP